MLNIDSKLRLQLFCPPARPKRQPKTTEVFEWWRTYPRNKYTSTLYVTVKGMKLPEHVSYVSCIIYSEVHFEMNPQLDLVILKLRWLSSDVFLQVDPSLRSMMALQEERGRTSFIELQNEVTKRSLTESVVTKPPVIKWNRLPGQVRCQ